MTNLSIQSTQRPEFSYPAAVKASNIVTPYFLNECLLDDSYRSMSPLGIDAVPDLTNSNTSRSNSIDLQSISSISEDVPSSVMFAGGSLSLSEAFDLDASATALFDFAQQGENDSLLKLHGVNNPELNPFHSLQSFQPEHFELHQQQTQFLKTNGMVSSLPEDQSVLFGFRDSEGLIKPVPVKDFQNEPLKNELPIVLQHSEYSDAASKHPSLLISPSLAPLADKSLAAAILPDTMHESVISDTVNNPVNTAKPFSPLQTNARGRMPSVAAQGILEGRIQKTFPCPEKKCGRLFARFEHAERHMRTHTGVKPYMCDICFKRCTRSDNVLQHKRLVHAGQPYSMNTCYTFSEK